jgi:predicted metal-dependent phosphoesterase TrpH
MKLQGALHLHSTYSDGEFSLAELRDVLRAAGCSFACVTDHAEAFDAAKLAAYVDECRRLSDDTFLLLPGLEFECRQRMHILGYGVPALLGTTDPQEVIEAIGQRGGVAVIAHPKDSHFPWIESFASLPAGIEAWNSKYDGRYAPRPGTFALIRRVQERRRDLRAFYGIDLHWRKQFRRLFTFVDCPALSRKAVLQSLAGGQFVGRKGTLRLPSSGDVPQTLLRRFAHLHRLSDGLRQVVRGAKKLLERCGATVPGALKHQLRRLF